MPNPTAAGEPEREISLAPLTDDPLLPEVEGAQISVLLPRVADDDLDGLPARYGHH
ncbi:hypothetical protein [Streptomyces sp. NPDC059788]|uniref:hypothetical protein n=1 Tax=Streptomyces sp. NPDC059788 TaxID=3346948 RepID=UPI003666C4A4